MWWVGTSRTPLNHTGMRPPKNVMVLLVLQFALETIRICFLKHCWPPLEMLILCIYSKHVKRTTQSYSTMFHSPSLFLLFTHSCLNLKIMFFCMEVKAACRERVKVILQKLLYVVCSIRLVEVFSSVVLGHFKKC